jgi:hypothetical protein
MLFDAISQTQILVESLGPKCEVTNGTPRNIHIALRKPILLHCKKRLIVTEYLIHVTQPPFTWETGIASYRC